MNIKSNTTGGVFLSILLLGVKECSTVLHGGKERFIVLHGSKKASVSKLIGHALTRTPFLFVNKQHGRLYSRQRHRYEL